MGNKVYVVTSTCTYDFLSVNTYVFDTLDKAKEKLEDLVAVWKKTNKGRLRDYEVSKTDNHFYAVDKYDNYEIDFKILEREVN